MTDVLIRPIDIDQDCHDLAEMWNASDQQWPDGWTGGVPVTAAMVREWEEFDHKLVTFVAQVGDRVVGYASFVKDHHGLKNEGYVGLVNVHPAYHGRSIGRRLLQATIDYSVEKGYKRQALDTWSANFKAVPTYKKTGHFWQPETSVLMDNHMPGARQMSLAKPYFQRHHWYDTYVRELGQHEDDEEWEGLKVYTQRWQEDGESLTIWVDREARAPVAIETDQIQVAAILDDIEPLTDSEVTLRWRVINKTNKSMQVYIHALGDKGLEIDHRLAFSVDAATTATQETIVKVANDCPKAKDDGMAPSIRSIIRIDEDEIELFSGLRARPRLSLDLIAPKQSLTPGISATWKAQLHNETDEAMDVLLQVTASDGLNLDWQHCTATVTARGYAFVPLSVISLEEGISKFTVHAACDQAKIEPLSTEARVYTLAPGGLLLDQQADSVTVETDQIRYVIASKEGVIRAYHKDSQLQPWELTTSLGPPYYPGEFHDKEFTFSCQPGPRAVIKMEAEAEHYKGLYLCGELAVSAAGQATLRYTHENRGHEPHALSLYCRVGNLGAEQQTMAFALPGGIAHSLNSIFPHAEYDAPPDPKDYAEPWFAWERRDILGGIAWDDSFEKIWAFYGLAIKTHAFVIEPGMRAKPIQMLLYAGEGDWRQVRQAALRWQGTWKSKKAEDEARPAILARVEPKTITTLDDQVEAQLLVDSLANRKLDGTVSLLTDNNLVASPSQVSFEALNRERSDEHTIRLSLPEKQLGVFSGHTQLDAVNQRTESAFDVIRLGTKAPVDVQQDKIKRHPVWRINNGSSEFVVCPSFGPSIIAWNRNGENELQSAFPEPTGLGWLYPSFNGLHTTIKMPGHHEWEGLLHREHVSAKPVTVQDRKGIMWTGVRLTVQPTQKRIKDLAIEIDLLTIGEADLIGCTMRLTNHRPTEQKIEPMLRLAAKLGAGMSDLVLLGDGIRRYPSAYGSRYAEQPWGALLNPDSGRCLLLVGQDDHSVGLNDAGIHGRILNSEKEITLSGNETRELVFYAVIADSEAQALQYTVLANQ